MIDPQSFRLVGNADVRVFHKHIPGVVYVTTDLTGKPDACYADYELMICHREPKRVDEVFKCRTAQKLVEVLTGIRRPTLPQFGRMPTLP